MPGNPAVIELLRGLFTAICYFEDFLMFLIPKAASAGTEAAECCPVNCNSYDFKQTHFSRHTYNASAEYFLQFFALIPKMCLAVLI